MKTRSQSRWRHRYRRRSPSAPDPPPKVSAPCVWSSGHRGCETGPVRVPVFSLSFPATAGPAGLPPPRAPLASGGPEPKAAGPASSPSSRPAGSMAAASSSGPNHSSRGSWSQAGSGSRAQSGSSSISAPSPPAGPGGPGCGSMPCSYLRRYAARASALSPPHVRLVSVVILHSTDPQCVCDVTIPSQSPRGAPACRRLLGRPVVSGPCPLLRCVVVVLTTVLVLTPSRPRVVCALPMLLPRSAPRGSSRPSASRMLPGGCCRQCVRHASARVVASLAHPVIPSPGSRTRSRRLPLSLPFFMPPARGPDASRPLGFRSARSTGSPGRGGWLPGSPCTACRGSSPGV